MSSSESFRYIYQESSDHRRYFLIDTYNQYIMAEFYLEDDIDRICDILNKNYFDRVISKKG